MIKNKEKRNYINTGISLILIYIAWYLGLNWYILFVTGLSVLMTFIWMILIAGLYNDEFRFIIENSEETSKMTEYFKDLNLTGLYITTGISLILYLLLQLDVLLIITWVNFGLYLFYRQELRKIYK
jgi:hypothetical protein